MGKQTTIPTRHVRVPEDLAKKLGEILDIDQDVNSAEFLDPLIRREIENRHMQLLPAIEAKRAADEQARKFRDELPEMVNDLGGEA